MFVVRIPAAGFSSHDIVLSNVNNYNPMTNKMYHCALIVCALITWTRKIVRFPTPHVSWTHTVCHLSLTPLKKMGGKKRKRDVKVLGNTVRDKEIRGTNWQKEMVKNERRLVMRDPDKRQKKKIKKIMTGVCSVSQSDCMNVHEHSSHSQHGLSRSLPWTQSSHGFKTCSFPYPTTVNGLDLESRMVKGKKEGGRFNVTGMLVEG